MIERQARGTYQRYRTSPSGMDLQVVGEALPADGPLPYPRLGDGLDSPDGRLQVLLEPERIIMQGRDGTEHRFVNQGEQGVLVA